ncbi:thiamine biosynthesis protein [Winogradskyella sp. PC-19]|uniref:FAD:protein FMN transferase n=1 Tax=unclassified Winogradskyella TaxID=2615021 RepID=UPI000B3BDDEE|nr:MULTISPECIES: FAD:protein FMN transferase [unclassified Winogradskyella]ARV10246.1 thiamine biosynthesis protein [Winogradskyella sp. PC-19]RZN82366.1 MAG: FAD:protein FMN transferase [Winogradskyella sp.]
MKRVILLLCVCLSFFSCKNEKSIEKNIKLNGPVFGTGYNIQYHSEEGINYQPQFDSLFAVINKSLSTYIPDSDISKWNRNEEFNVDKHFRKVFNTSKKIFKESKGIFDPTIGNVVNAWNFGPDENKFLTDSATIQNLMKHVGFDNVKMLPTRFIKPDTVYLDFNAIAKGYGIDVIADFIASKGINNYLVDIGGDMRSSGINKDSKKGWTVGIEDPNFDGSKSYSKAITLKNMGMATSGTYRKFKLDAAGNRYAHIIDTKTGYPTKTNVLSVTVIAPSAMLADAYATTFQAMGVEEAKHFLNVHPELQAYFIYLDKKNVLKIMSLNGFAE